MAARVTPTIQLPAEVGYMAKSPYIFIFCVRSVVPVICEHLPAAMSPSLKQSRYITFFSFAEHKILIIGLDNAGKTTIMYQYLLGDTVHTSPTIGSNVEEITYKNTQFVMWDLGGQESLRASWNTYYANTQVRISAKTSALSNCSAVCECGCGCFSSCNGWYLQAGFRSS